MCFNGGMRTAAEMTEALISFTSAVTHVAAEAEALTEAMAAPGSYSIQVPIPVPFDKFVVTVRRLGEAHGFRVTTEVAGRTVFVDVKEVPA